MVDKELVVRPDVTTEDAIEQVVVTPQKPVAVTARPVIVAPPPRVNRTPPQPAPALPSSIILNAGEHFDFDEGAKAATNAGDIMWATAGDSRYLVPLRSAKVALMGKAAFERVALDTLKAQTFSSSAINASSVPNNLTPGTVIGILTSSGNYAKMRVDRNGPSLTMTWTTFK